MSAVGSNEPFRVLVPYVGKGLYYRPRPGEKNLPNIIRIINKEWLAWINRGPPPLRAAIGFNLFHPTASKAARSPSVYI
ncbi:hypothetical protein AU381_22165 [Sinorhizobium glycinis]|uniref:Uncharacterized protein n=1 Tax=Sinorhizobium glycinis TaxID=1472378 RepID=A0A178XSX2_9HYPH|nr:hypothetical protein AU381_22165 [Sinorhizobium glycinis]